MKIYERSGEAEGQKVGCVAGRGECGPRACPEQAAAEGLND